MATHHIRHSQDAPPASPEEAAAIAAALESFLRETAPSRAGSAEGQNPWTRAAMLEGVSREDHADVPHPWINT
jgi:hypothetical protein